MLNEENRTFIFNKIKRERKREMIPTTSTHCENRRTERTRRGRTERTDGRSAPGGASLAALPVWGVLFNWFPTFFNPFEKCILFDPFFIPFQKACFAVFYQLFSMWPVPTRFSTLFPFCPRVSLSETCFQTPRLTMSIKQNQKQSKNVSEYPLFCVQWLLTKAINGSVCQIGRTIPISRQYPKAIST